jgi:RimJ/RimL family protein N-acetyltransferase
MQLETDRLVLRSWRTADWPAFFRLTNTPAVMRWLAGVFDAAGMAAQRARIEGFEEQYGHTFWAVERKQDGGHLAGELLGFCGLKRGDSPDSPVFGEFEIGWRLREDAWGHGYAREAAEASLAAGFEQFGAERIVALTIIENSGSWGLMERLGMVRRPDLDFVEGRYPPPFCHAIAYCITREEWTTR